MKNYKAYLFLLIVLPFLFITQANALVTDHLHSRWLEESP